MNMKLISQRGPKQRALIGAWLLLLSVSSAQAWRAFDAIDGVRHFSTDYFQPPPSPFMTNFYTNSQPINLAQFENIRQQQQQQQQAQAVQTQTLTPASAQVHQFATSSGPQLSNLQEQTAAVSSSSQPQNPREAQQEFTKHELGHEQQHQLGVRQAPPAQMPSTRAPASNQPVSVAPPADAVLSDSVAGRDISQKTPSEASHKSQPEPDGTSDGFQQKPSPFGKILDALYQSPSGANATSDNQASKSQNATTSKPALQVLKARRTGESRKQTPAAIEQQIIDQHARAAAGYNSHSSEYLSSPSPTTTPKPQQRLQAVTKNRGDSGGPNRFGAILLNSLGVLAGSSASSSSSSSSFHDDPTSSSSSQQLHPSPIARIMDNFKSGISSRSSIMKAAISDNKLARTLTSVSKTLGGNKYVASAGIAAALAALGLTVGKYLSPYSLSSGAQYSKISADPLLPSGSLGLPLFSVPGNYAPNERHFANWAADLNPYNELTATSSNNMPYEMSPSSNYGQFEPQQAGIDQAALNQMAAAAGLYPGSQHAYTGPESAAQNFLGQQSQISNQFWSGPVNYQVLQPATSQKSASRGPKPFGTANGHYSNFYSRPEIDAATSDNSDQNVASPLPMQTQQPQQAPQQYGTYVPGAPISTNFQEQNGLSSKPRQQAGVAEQPQASFDQMPSASLETATYQKAPAFEQPTFSSKGRAGSTGRRSGAVILKLDEATRSRLEQLSASERNKQAAEPQPYASYFVLKTPIEQQQQQASSAVAQQATLSRGTRAHQAQFLAPLTTMTNRQQWTPATDGEQAPSPNKSTFEQASGEGQLSASGGQSLDSIRTAGVGRAQEWEWRQASQNNENTRPTAASPTKQSAPEYQFIRPTSGERHQQPAADEIVFGFANEHAKVSSARAQPQRQTILDGGWKSIDASSSGEMATNQSPDETGRSEYARGHDSASSGGQLNRVSRTPGRPSGRPSSAAAEQGKLTSEQLQQMVALINQQRALEKANADELQMGAMRQSASEQHLLAAPGIVGSIRNKSGEPGGEWNEVVQPTPAVTKTTPALQQDNHDKTPKSIGSPVQGGATQLAANESVDANEAPIDGDNKQSSATTTTTRQAANSDNVVLELVDAGELLGPESNASATVAPAKQKPDVSPTKGAGEPQASQQQADTDQSSDNNANANDDDQEQLGKARAYLGLVAGSIGANADN